MANKYILEGHKAVPCDDILKWARWFENANKIVRKLDTDSTKGSKR